MQTSPNKFVLCFLLFISLVFSELIFAESVKEKDMSTETAAQMGSDSSSDTNKEVLADQVLSEEKEKVTAETFGPVKSDGHVKTRYQLIKFSLTLLGLVILMYVAFIMLRKTSLFKHLADNPLHIKSVIAVTGKSRLALIEVHGAQILVGVTDHNVNLIKEIKPDEIKQNSKNVEPQDTTTHQLLDETYKHRVTQEVLES